MPRSRRNDAPPTVHDADARLAAAADAAAASAPPSSMTAPASAIVHDSAAGAADPRHCGGRKRQGEGTCTRPAGWGTDHVGVGPCKLHGGNNRVKHGRYSRIKRSALRHLIAEYEADPDPLNILPELAAERALFVDFIQRYDAWRAALLAWHASDLGSNRPMRPDKVAALKRILTDYEAERADEAGESAEDLPQQERELLADAREVLAWLAREPEGKPREVLDLADAYKIVAEITKIVERIERIRATQAITAATFLRVMNELGAVVEAHVPDQAIQLRIRDGWLEVKGRLAA